jgi:hypothetical protein
MIDLKDKDIDQIKEILLSKDPDKIGPLAKNMLAKVWPLVVQWQLRNEAQRSTHYLGQLSEAIEAYNKINLSIESDVNNKAIQLLRDLYDLQNGPPLIRYEKEYNKTINEVGQFLAEHDCN